MLDYYIFSKATNKGADQTVECIFGLIEINGGVLPFLLWPADPGQTVSSGYEGSVTL